MKLLTVAEVAEQLAVSPRTVQRLVRERAIGYVPVRGGYRFRQEHVDEYVRRQEVLPDRPVAQIRRLPSAGNLQRLDELAARFKMR